MTATVEGDFREFVAARWGDLESVTRVVVLDPDLARDTTATALGRLQERWAEVVEEGRPGEAARGAVLMAAVRAARRGAPAAAGRPGEPDVGGRTPGQGHDVDDDDTVVPALVTAVVDTPPVERAILAAAVLWDADTTEVAHLLGMPVAGIREQAESLRTRLETAHDGARTAAGLAPAPWARDGDVRAAVEVLLDDLGDPPDPAGLVAGHQRGVRRRTLVGGAVAMAALGGAAVAVARRTTSSDLPAQAGPTTPATLAPDDDRWASAARWPARGPLANDPSVSLLVGRRGAAGDHVLWAGDLGSRRVVVCWTRPDPDLLIGTAVRVFAGPSGTDATVLPEVGLPFGSVQNTVDVVGLAIPDGFGAPSDRALLLLLTRPTLTSASVSFVVRPTRAGGVERSWSPVRLENGVAAKRLDRPVAAALRVRAGFWEGPGITTAAPFDAFDTGPRSSDVRGWAQAPIAALTGIPARGLRTVVVVDEQVPGRLFNDPGSIDGSATARVLSLETTTPAGAVVRTTAYLDDRVVVPLEPGYVVPAATRDQPHFSQVSDLRPDVSRYLVVAPGADRVQLISSAPDGYPISKVHRTGGRAVVVVPVINGNISGAYRIITRDRRGRLLFDGVPAQGQWLLEG